ncbi:fimbrial family protein (plasmid) [Klebsiella oxytoca]|uniref:fimbrial protein n=1 Tax=Klebsiella oxytoca TaxID=571 RepID=UPI000D528A4E|nr:fimbrial protein [Klebsiella oxytoca]AWF33356.1 fimbrial family protein [Klebsiella oxytoca]
MKQQLAKQKIQKRTAVTSGVIAAVAWSMTANTWAASDRATITITGKVLANTCTIDSASARQNITLPNIADRDIKGVGKTGGETNISIALTDCGKAASNVVVTASGTPDAEDPTAFSNTVTDGAEGVGLYFYQTGGTEKFKPDGSVRQTSPLTPSVDNTLTYKASYVGTNDTVKAGGFSTVVNMTFEYQ